MAVYTEVSDEELSAFVQAYGIGAVLIEPGSSMIYFTGVRWGRSERPTLALLPREGEPLIVTPFFEEPSVRQTLAVPAEVRVWQEDGNALRIVADWLKERRLDRLPVGIEETVRVFIPADLARFAPDVAADDPRLTEAVERALSA